MLYVRDLMQTELVTVTPGATVRELARLLEDHQISGGLAGIVTSADVLRAVADGRLRS
jgi:CBS domain-containing protein